MTSRMNRKTGMDPLVRMMLLNWASGIVVGLVCAGIVLAVDMAGIRSLMLRSNFLWQGLALLFGGFAITFGGVVCATAIMTLPTEEEQKPRGGHGQRILARLLHHAAARPALAPVPVAVRRERV